MPQQGSRANRLIQQISQALAEFPECSDKKALHDEFVRLQNSDESDTNLQSKLRALKAEVQQKHGGADACAIKDKQILDYARRDARVAIEVSIEAICAGHSFSNYRKEWLEKLYKFRAELAKGDATLKRTEFIRDRARQIREELRNLKKLHHSVS